MASSKSSQTTRNIIIACLALWSIISLITIVVWATSPDMKGASQCRAELQALQSTFDKEKAVWIEDRLALEEKVRHGWDNQTKLLSHIDQLKDQLKQLNLSLEACQQENAALNANITSLENDIVLHKAIEANLTANISQQQDLIEHLQLNVTQTVSALESCDVQTTAAKLLQTSAEKQQQACQTKNQYLDKQLVKCKQQPKSGHTHGSESNGPPGPTSGIAMVVIVCISLLLIP
ncbi:uncharacterized protein si:ch211-1a19.3 [Colossoma macropomum]|uniref:uncharacterized protein si:ch211-1a19.3 n=1 Tax=Colossoma macropomum TaxID=42526 RepID=UPI00186527BA|nr:uncharacterized protein si:ch211-1a19.3 [Colossoma macropomum]